MDILTIIIGILAGTIVFCVSHRDIHNQNQNLKMEIEKLHLQFDEEHKEFLVLLGKNQEEDKE